MKNSFPLSPKYIDFINSIHNVSADFLEGTTASGKTTVGAGVKFMRMVSASSKKLHIIASKTTGTAEKNIIQQDNGILDLHRNAQYYGNGDNGLTFNRITAMGFDKLTDFQKSLVKRSVALQVNFIYDNSELLDSPLNSYSIGGVSMSFDKSKVITADGVTSINQVYSTLMQTGLCYRGVT